MKDQGLITLVVRAGDAALTFNITVRKQIMSLKSLNTQIKQAEESFYLKNTTFLLQIPEKQLRTQLTALYNSNSEVMRLLGSVINSIYTEGKTTFFLSKRSLLKLIENDKANLEYKSRKGINLGKGRMKLTYLRQELIKEMKENGLFSVLQEASQANRTPSVIEMIDDELFDMLDENGYMSKQLRSNWKQAALNTVKVVEEKKKLVLNESLLDCGIEVDMSNNVQPDFDLNSLSDFQIDINDL